MKEIISVLLLTSLSLYSVTFSPLAVSISSTLADTTTNETPPLAIQVPLEENKGFLEEILPSSEIVPIALPKKQLPEVKKPIHQVAVVSKEIPVVRKERTPPKELPKESAIIAPSKKPFDIQKLAHAVARHETGGCKLGYGKEYNNCFGIKNGNTAPCPKIGRNRMCIYETPEQSYEAFKIIWSKWYGEMPTLKSSQRWSGNDRAENWMRNVTNFYYGQD